MHVQRLQTMEELADLGEHWNCLTRGVPFRSWQWQFNWWRHFGQDRELYLLAVFDDDESLVGVAPWFAESCPARGTVLKFLASEDVAASHLSLLSTVEHEKAVAREVGNWLTRADAGNRWDVIELTGIDARDSIVQVFADALAMDNHRVDHRTESGGWHLHLPNSWEQYVASLAESHRGKVERAAELLAAGRAALRTIQRREEVGGKLEALCDLIGQRCNLPFAQAVNFLRSAAEGLFDDRRLQLHELELDGKRAAAELHLCGCDTTYVYCTTVETNAQNNESHLVIRTALLQKAIDDGQLQFCVPSDQTATDTDWHGQPLGLASFYIANRAGSHRRHGILAAGDAMKNWVKTGLGLVGMH